MSLLKNFRPVFIIALFSALSFYLPFVYAAPGKTTELSAEELVKELQNGGHIIYMRHSITDQNQSDTNRQDLDDCSSQRNLSTAGIEQATLIGSKIKSLGIPVGQVLSSPYCRCKDTAKLVYGQYQVEPDLIFSMSKDRRETELLARKLYDMMLKTDTQSDNNSVFVGHTSNLRDSMGIWPKPEGVLVVLKNIDNKIVYKGMIKPSDWLNF